MVPKTKLQNYFNEEIEEEFQNNDLHSQESPLLNQNDPKIKIKFSENKIKVKFKQKTENHEELDSDDQNPLIPQINEVINQEETPETRLSIFFQMLFPFVVAGFGMVAAGIVLDRVQHWQVFEKVPEIFILVPALLGLKGNLEMTLASRLSTNANRGLLDEPISRNSIIFGNMILVEAQAMVVAFLASLVAMVLGWIPDGTWETNHAILLCVGSLLTGAIASLLLGGVMIFVILISRKFGINPDNVATPIAASLGDLVTLLLLSYIVSAMYTILYDPKTSWIAPTIIFIFIILTPFFLWLAHRNPFTKEVVKNGWEPVIAAMTISSAGGFILDFAVSMNPGIAVFSPVINGIGGNLVAVQASRISTYLHTSGFRLGELPNQQIKRCISPIYLVCSKDNPHSIGAQVMLIMVIPGQLLFLLTIQGLQAGHTTISIQFILVYLLMSLIQVCILLHVCYWLVLFLWQRGSDPDNSAIPYLTALGDLLGTGLLGIGFIFLWMIGDRDMDVGD